MNTIRLSLLLLLTITVYAFVHLLWYWQTPLGQSPVLDGLENLVLAQKIATGQLPHEPFYRAMLYPSVLSLFFRMGFDANSVAFIAGLLGLVLHVTVAGLSMRISWLLWQSRIGLVVTGALIGFNPVFIHFACDPLDIALATALFFGGICMMSEIDAGRTSVFNRLLAGVLIGMAPLARPHLFAPALAIWVILFGISIWKKSNWKPFVLIGTGGAVPLLIYALIQLSWGGSFGVLPWQGAYNLWASNKPGANGLYLKQSVFIHDLGEHQNPTRVESDILYEREVGEAGTIAERSSYWRSKAISSVMENPGEWLELMAWKSYALINNYEQYNNKTYAFHKARSPWLRFNPISTGGFFVLASVGVFLLWRRDKRLACVILIVGASYGSGVLIYMTSGRFRAPMMPLWAVLAGGLPLVSVVWKELNIIGKIVLLALPLMVGVISFSRFGGIDSRDTEIQDVMLLADASAKLGRDREAMEWSEKAYTMNPLREDAFRIKMISYYNLVTSGEENYVNFDAGNLENVFISDPIFDYVKGIVYWNRGKKDLATNEWGRSLEKYGWKASSSLGALILVDPSLTVPKLPNEIIDEIRGGYHSVLSIALCKRNPDLIERFAMSDSLYHRRSTSLARALAPGSSN